MSEGYENGGASEQGRLPNPAERVLEAQLADEAQPALVLAALSDETDGQEPPRRRRVRLPVIMLLLTCASTFWVGASHFWPWPAVTGFEMRRVVYANWPGGFVYMASLIGILFAHEMGHFLFTVYYRIAASLPYFIPFPISPIGTFGAVIGMESMRADRKQMFDIGIGGPLAGLVIAIPVCWAGMRQIDFTEPLHGPFAIGLPLAMQWALDFLRPEGYDPATTQIAYSQLNPLLLAGWVGLLVTGLNMVPIGQFDGGHIAYTVLGPRIAHWLARAALVFAIAYTVYSENYNLMVMVGLFVLVGPDHPPTRDDTVPLGWFRWILGLVSLIIPILCLSPNIISFR